MKQELEDFMQLWNTHYMRRNNKARIPHGIPNDLYADSGNVTTVEPLLSGSTGNNRLPLVSDKGGSVFRHGD